MSKKYKLKMDDLYNNVDNNPKIKNLLKKYKNKQTSEIIKNYFLQYFYGELCSDYIYNKDSKLKTPISIDGEIQKNLLFYINTACYFASEAYYTTSTINSIVLEDQLKHKLNYGKRKKHIIHGIYLTAVMENLGDMLNHMGHEDGDVKKTLIKYSKYLYRIYLSLGKINSKYTKIANDLNKYVIPFRKTYDIESANKQNIWKYLYYNGKDNKSQYMNKITDIISNIINDTIKNSKQFRNILEKDIGSQNKKKHGTKKQSIKKGTKKKRTKKQSIKKGTKKKRSK
tara:strand:- start:586 stop:1437 length:852 start_codon:yes stop_codon:yes gene_type:complete